MNNLYEIRNLKCTYDKPYVEGKSKVVLEIDHLDIPRGKKVFIVGESGIGKSTILETLGLMNDTIVHNPKTVLSFGTKDGDKVDLLPLWSSGQEKHISDFRLKYYSFIFQGTNLMRNFTAMENAMFTRMLQGYSYEECLQRARNVLRELGLPNVDEKRMAHELSGGQQQRLAFARAILTDFDVLFGDEPTGNLDGENAERVMQILRNALDTNNHGASAIIVSHDMPLAMRFADIIIKIRRMKRETDSEDGEMIVYGKIDPKCVFTRNGETWTNGEISYTDPKQFERFLRNITDL